jgi:hypothetical protein
MISPCRWYAGVTYRLEGAQTELLVLMHCVPNCCNCLGIKLIASKATDNPEQHYITDFTI